MKNGCIIFLLSLIIGITAFGFFANEGGRVAFTDRNSEFLRIHIRADSNQAEAQAVKYKVRDAVVEYLTPLVADCQTYSEAMVGVRANEREIACVATRVLREEGFSYEAKASLKWERFPTRVYGEYTLPAGEYAALILELGSGEGDNWWCVVYPPLCFASTSDVVYKSKILEIIEAWREYIGGME